MDYRATILLYAELVLALYLLWREGLLRERAPQAVALLLVPLAFVLRYCLLTYETLDYQDWIRVWIQSLRDNGAWKGLGQEIWSCNYNVPYVYFLSLISLSGMRDLLLVKLLSIFFDVVMAWAVMRLVGVLTQSPVKKLSAFVLTLWLPSIVLNGALWGQCDVIYGAFAVLAVYFALDDHPALSVISIALSVSFKLQGVFLLPVWFLFLLKGKIKFKHIFLFPLTYVLSILPAVFAGRGFWELLTLYLRNTGTIGDGLNYNSSSVYALHDFSAMTNAAGERAGIIMTAVFCVGLFLWFAVSFKKMDDKALFGACVLFAIGVPFFLPHMHDRYFFIADMLTLTLAVAEPWLVPVAAGVSFGSLLGYHAYLKMRYLMPMRYGAIAMLASLLLTLAYTVYHTYRKPRTSAGKEIAS